MLHLCLTIIAPVCYLLQPKAVSLALTLGQDACNPAPTGYIFLLPTVLQSVLCAKSVMLAKDLLAFLPKEGNIKLSSHLCAS